LPRGVPIARRVVSKRRRPRDYCSIGRRKARARRCDGGVVTNAEHSRQEGRGVARSGKIGLARPAMATHVSPRGRVCARAYPMIAALLIGIIRIYQRLISPLLPPACRFEPSCSRYAVACLETHDAVRGSLLSAVRLCKCHPFHPGGIDLPPPKHRDVFTTPPPTPPPAELTRENT